MKLIRRVSNEIISNRTHKMGIFLCPICGKNVKKIVKDAIHAKYCSHVCYSKSGARKIKKGPRKERVLISNYWYVMLHDHPRRNRKGYVPEQIVVVEKHIGRYLRNDETVHHINKNTLDNRLKNLKLMKIHDHLSFHAKEKHKKANGRKWGQGHKPDCKLAALISEVGETQNA